MKKKFTQFKWLVAMILFVTAMAMPKMAWAQVTTNQPDNGDGTAANPYQITTAAELAWFRDFVNAGNETACARLEANIDMSTVCHQATESESVAELSWVPIGNSSRRWHGEFNGNNKTISNLYINASEAYSGFFGHAHNWNEGQRGIIKDITFENVNITSTADYSGVLAGYAWNTDISGITVNSGSINGYEDVGGIVGYAAATKISNCVNRISIVGSDYAIGGIVGYAQSSSITNCANYVNVKGRRMVGGIVGQSNGLTLCNVFSSGDVTFSSTANGSGLVVGYANSTLTISGYVIYNSDAKRYYVSNEQAPVALGEVYSSATVTGESNIVGLNSENLKTGEGAWMLNGQQSTGAWGQQLAIDNYPVLGGLPVYFRDEVYTNIYGILTVGTQTITASNESPIWYEFTPTEAGSYQFSSTQLTAGNLYVNTTQNESDYTDIATSPTYDLEAATTYYVAVSGAPGSYDLTITRLNNTPTAIETVTAPQIYAVDGRIVCDGEFRIYDLLGRDVTRLNGSLCGVYIVKTADATQKVVVK